MKKILFLLAVGSILFVVAQKTFDKVVVSTAVSSPTPNVSALIINSFEECVEAGFPVLESYPEQCKTETQTFIRDIGNEMELSDNIQVNSPRPGETIASPLQITGQARGPWYFEASFPVQLEDANGIVIAESVATAQGEWMTEEFVPFMSTLSFDASTETGTLVLAKDNPSGLPENDSELRIPISFE